MKKLLYWVAALGFIAGGAYWAVTKYWQDEEPVATENYEELTTEAEFNDDDIDDPECEDMIYDETTIDSLNTVK